MRQQFADVTVFGAWQPREHVGQPGMWITVVGFRRGEQAHDRRGAFARLLGAGEEPILPAQGDGPDRALDRVVVDRVTAIVQIARQRGPAPQGVVDCIRRSAVADPAASD